MSARPDRSVEIKTRGELQSMRAAGVVLARAIEAGRAAAVPGSSTADVDAAVAAVIADAGARPNFLGYHGFPATICASVNDEVVHGIPRPDRVLRDGDLLSIDAGCIVDGWHADSAVSLHVGSPPEDEAGAAETDLILAAQVALWAGIAATRAGGRIGDISQAVETAVLRAAHEDGRRYGSVSGYGGHGIGSAMHMDPFVPNQGKRGKGVRIVDGMALAIEPMVTLGKSSTRELDDGWTVVTKDGARAAHVEHTVAVTDEGICVTTALDGGAARLARYDITPISLD
ncbi:type I methionyl aminopeptidase [Nakamurella flavida]|uniref:Methionine aminopeptidase n=1 Tax=Nakamurella flavida TaxID=363630 RepID=A0A938YMD0_9ACTN|nr:type I methionyl aminopeptidase [Nakamurella flavida]MBM9475879.1 type I methionyl aminopeptidase [Nakamurella flavida]MDP9777836.1 methionyl aminopeptidase [Nakamurella flavida]